MLRLRILTSVVLIPLMVWVTLQWPTVWFGGFIGVFILVAAWEWTALCGISHPASRLAYLAVMAAVGAAVAGLPVAPYGIAILGLTVAWWLWALAELAFSPKATRGVLASTPGKLASGYVVLIPAWLAPVWLHGTPALVLYLFVLVWAADSVAYFVGRPWGKTKLAPTISPGKTWEGVAGGIVGALLVALGGGWFVWKFTGGDLIIWAMMAVVATFFSVLGDLFESRAKRAVGVKDSGTLFPGHGGVFDRIDAYTAAAPVFALAWLVWRSVAGTSA